MMYIKNELNEFLREHPKLLQIIKLLENKHLMNVEVSLETHPDFFMLIYRCLNGESCPFSLWLERSSDDVIFFNIGERQYEAAVIHYCDISSRDVLEEVILILTNFPTSSIEEEKKYCNEILKKVSYRLLNNEQKKRQLKYTYLVENVLICFNPRTIHKVYRPWVIESQLSNYI